MPRPDRILHLIVERPGRLLVAHPLHRATCDEISLIVQRIGPHVPPDATWSVGKP